MTFPHTATVRRMTKTGTKYVYGDAGSTECFLQPLDEESSVVYGITMSKGSRVYLPIGADVLKADELVINGTTYGVKGLRTHQYGSLNHMRAILEEV